MGFSSNFYSSEDFTLDYVNSRRVYHGEFKRNGDDYTSLLFGHYSSYVLVTVDWTQWGISSYLPTSNLVYIWLTTFYSYTEICRAVRSLLMKWLKVETCERSNLYSQKLDCQ